METELTPREIVAELDKYIIGQQAAKKAVAIALRNRLSAAPRSARPGRRDHAEEHPDDRPDGGREDGDLPPAGQAGVLAVSENRGQQVHRGRVRRPGRRIHRSGTSSGWPWTWFARRNRGSPKRRPRPEAEEKLLDLLLPPVRRREANAVDEKSCSGTWNPGKKCANSSGTGFLRIARSRSRSRNDPAPPLEIFSNQGVEEIGLQIQEIIPGFMGGRRKNARSRCRKPGSIPVEDERSARGHGPGFPPGRRTRRALGHRFPGRSGQDRRPGNGPGARRQPRRRPTRPPADRRRDDREYARTDSSTPITCCSSAPAPSTSPGPPTSSPSSRADSRSGWSSRPSARKISSGS